MARVCLPSAVFNDRRVHGSHLRVLAAIAMLGEGAMPQREISASCGISDRDLRRTIRELVDYVYLTVRLFEGEESSYEINYGEGNNTPGEQSSPEGVVDHTPDLVTVSPPDGPLLPPAPPITPLNPPASADVGSARAFRLPEGWEPTAANTAYAASQGFDGDGIALLATGFREHWHARAGPEATRVDWGKAWAQYVRNGDGRSTRGRRLPEGWEPGTGDREFAHGLGLDCRAVADEFRDYWRAIPGSKGCKLDWSATFRNRCREIAGRNRSNGAGRPVSNRQGPGSIVAALDRITINYPDPDME